MGDREQEEYEYSDSKPSHTQSYLWPVVEQHLSRFAKTKSDCNKVFDIGCGNGAFLKRLKSLGYEPTGIDPSESGIANAKKIVPPVNAELGSAYDDLQSKFGTFPMVVSLEVVEHVYSPREYARNCYNLLQPDGIAVISTPFHGYWKNLLLALTGKMDSHFTALWDHGHIKFWSPKTLSALLAEAGFDRIEFAFAGRVYPFSKSMLAIARKPTS